MTTSFALNSSLEEMSFIGYDRFEKNSFNRSNQIKTEAARPDELLIKDSFNGTVTDKNTIQFVREIRNPVDFKAQGIVILKYNFSHLKDIYIKYEGKHDILIIDHAGYVMYSSNGGDEYEKYEYCDEILSNNPVVRLDKNYYISKISNPLGITSIAKISKREVGKMPIGLIGSIIAVDILLLIISLSIMYMKLRKLNDRTNKIIIAMDEVKGGNLNVEIPITSDNDEINYISQSFNRMCKDLDEYIKKSYLSQIEQKKAEMTALQNQINPHFLYNTLESIRMKAISNGDREVGKMLYTLSFLFRKQLKDDNIITLKDELYYCQQYINIFKFRYDDNFNFEINCPKDLEQCEIIKFSIQPIIENYFIHGIRLEDFDNLLKINVFKEDNDVFIKIIDNGKGMGIDGITLMNLRLIGKQNWGNSMGVSNVHERLVGEYGEGYGLEFSQNTNMGVTVTVRIQYRGV